jgi:hypothetical protein
VIKLITETLQLDLIDEYLVRMHTMTGGGSAARIGWRYRLIPRGLLA